ncbi:MAG: hypothetical protein JSR46_01450 [Verrucomicrobia bacterium]|nr:hypothetical protein [Verrucomicrobiota bacterium]
MSLLVHEEVNPILKQLEAQFIKKCEKYEIVTCPVCLQPPSDVTQIVGCVHKFCLKCIEDCVSSKKPCPVCTTGKSFTKDDFRHDFDTQRVIDKIWAMQAKKAGLEKEPNPYRHAERLGDSTIAPRKSQPYTHVSCGREDFRSTRK